MENQTTQPKKLPKLTRKQRGFVKDYVLTENGTQSALNNYDIESKDPEKVASVIATENLGKPSIINAIEVKRKSLKEALIEKGIDEAKIADKINVLLEAKKPVYEKNDKGVFENVGDEIDFTAVDKGLKHAKEIYGVEDSDKPKENVYNFFFEPKFQQNIKNYDQNLKEQILNKDAE